MDKEMKTKINSRWRCPKCNEIGFWRSGMYFDHEMWCHGCETVWEPDKWTNPKKVFTYKRKPYEVKARRVTKDNLDEVEKWCGGFIEYEGHIPVIHVDWKSAKVGEWIVLDPGGIRVLSDKEFKKTYYKE